MNGVKHKKYNLGITEMITDVLGMAVADVNSLKNIYRSIENNSKFCILWKMLDINKQNYN
jgi:hypothetical protein